MNKRLFRELAKDNPVEINEKIANGLSYYTLRTAKEDVDKIIRIASADLPEDFSYNGSTICNPQESYRVLTGRINKSSNRGQSIDFAESDFFLAKYHFSLGTEELTPRYQMLPLVTKGGLLRIGGRQFNISPVLGDLCFSIGQDSVFIRINRAVVTFRTLYHAMDVDGETDTRVLTWALLHNRGGTSSTGKGSDRIKIGHVHTTMGHYLFAKYGLMETFKKYAKCEIHLTREHDLEHYLKENKLDIKDYHVVRSKKIRPVGFKARVVYTDMQSDLVVLVNKKQKTDAAMDMVGCIFYMTDFYPDEIDIEDMSGTWLWKVWLGYLLFGDTLGNNRLVENIESHLSALDDYVDEGVRHLLMEEEGLDIRNFYQLAWHMSSNMVSMLANNKGDLASMYGKSLIVNQYVLSEIRTSIFRMMFNITNNPKKTYTAKNYNRQLGIHMQHAILTRLRRTSEHPYMSTASLPGDNMLFQLGIKLVRQERTRGIGGRGARLNVSDPTNRLHESILEAGNYLVFPKRTPIGDSTINPTAKLNNRWTILQKEHLKDVIEYVGNVISRE